MNCNCCCCPCLAAFNASAPVATSGAAVDAAACATTGTLDNVNAIAKSGSSILSALFKSQTQQKALSVRAQQFTSTQQSNLLMFTIIAVVVVIGFMTFAQK